MASNKDTIIAPATAVADAGIAVVRISGDRSLSFLQTYFKSHKKDCDFDSHHLYLGRIFDTEGNVIDEVMAVYMAPPRTYTCEPVVEIQCHGSRQVVTRILDLAHNHHIRLAQPGEFTYRAYLNGRLDLVQAEAVSRLIQSTTDLSRRSALQQLDGFLSRQLHYFSTSIKQILVHIEAWIDFPEETLPEENINHFSDTITYICQQMSDLTNTYHAGQFVHNGATVAFAGLPNAGKSSLMNALLQQERSIVSHVPGTTRDTIEQSFQLDGIQIRLIDTAGLRDSNDFVEQEGVRRAKTALSRADLVLLVLDGTVPPCDDFRDLVASFSDVASFLVVNKTDIMAEHPDLHFYGGPVVFVSAKHGSGLSELKKQITDFLLRDYLPSSEPAYLTEQRHYEALSAAAAYLNRFLVNLGTVELDLLSIDLRDCLHALASITGEVSSEAVLDEIFSTFCIGK